MTCARPLPGKRLSLVSAHEPPAVPSPEETAHWMANTVPIISSVKNASCSRNGARNRPPVTAIQANVAVYKSLGRRGGGMGIRMVNLMRSVSFKSSQITTFLSSVPTVHTRIEKNENDVKGNVRRKLRMLACTAPYRVPKKRFKNRTSDSDYRHDNDDQSVNN